MTSIHRSTKRSFWLLAGRRLRISYNTRPYDWRAAAFRKIDVLHPRGASLPQHATGHLSLVLKDWNKLDADRDYIAYAQRFLTEGQPVYQRYRPARIAAGRFPLF